MKTLDQRLAEISDRVDAFRRLALPGQPMAMHMGTSYLVSDLWLLARDQQAEIHRLKSAATGEVG